MLMLPGYLGVFGSTSSFEASEPTLPMVLLDFLLLDKINFLLLDKINFLCEATTNM